MQVALAAVGAFLFGLVVGSWLFYERAVAIRAEEHARALAELSPPAGGAFGEGRHASSLEAAAADLLERLDGAPRAGAARAVAAFGAQQWARGASDLRSAVVHRTNLPPEVGAAITDQAFRAIEGR